MGEEKEEDEGRKEQGVDVGGGWKRYWDDVESANYWHNTETGQTKWEDPLSKEGQDEDVQEEEEAVSEEVDKEEDERKKQGVVLGGGWIRYWDEGEQANYWHNPNTGETSWDEPPASKMNTKWTNLYDGRAYPAGAWNMPLAIKPVQPGSQGNQKNNSLTSSKFPDGYDWDTYAMMYGFRTGQDAYNKYYYGSIAGKPQGPENKGTTQAFGGFIYEPSQGDSASRLNQVLANLPEGEVGDAEPAVDEDGLTEAQKIFGTNETFTAPELAEAAAMSKGIVASKKTEDGRPQITPEDIAAAAEGLLDQIEKGPITMHRTDITKHTRIAEKYTREVAVRAAMNGETPKQEQYLFHATFNKTSGRFEGAGQIHKLPVDDPRRQTSHYFDYDKWATDKAAKSARAAKRAKTNLGL